MKSFNLFLLSLSPLLAFSLPVPAPSPAVPSPSISKTLEFPESLEEAFSSIKLPITTLQKRVDLVENGLSTDPCKALTVVFARGTSEDGNVGKDVGAPLFTALRATLGVDQVTAQGVDYAANVLGLVFQSVIWN
jgi:cutinase